MNAFQPATPSRFPLASRTQVNYMQAGRLGEVHICFSFFKKNGLKFSLHIIIIIIIHKYEFN
jgi:hypothetical protein